MKLHQSAASYRAVAIRTATPGQLILMLFDGALRFIGAAEQAFNEENIVKRNELVHNNIVRALNILRELQSSLNMDAGGEFASQMYGLYDFMSTQLQTANLEKKVEPLQLVYRLLGEIRDAWSEMLNKSLTRPQ